MHRSGAYRFYRFGTVALYVLGKFYSLRTCGNSCGGGGQRKFFKYNGAAGKRNCTDGEKNVESKLYDRNKP